MKRVKLPKNLVEKTPYPLVKTKINPLGYEIVLPRVNRKKTSIRAWAAVVDGKRRIYFRFYHGKQELQVLLSPEALAAMAELAQAIEDSEFYTLTYRILPKEEEKCPTEMNS